MNTIDTKGLIVRILIPTTVLSLSYLLLGQVCHIPCILLFCILGTIILLPLELGTILFASKNENGAYSLKSAFVGQKKQQLWKSIMIALAFFCMAGLLQTFVAPIENKLFAGLREKLL